LEQHSAAIGKTDIVFREFSLEFPAISSEFKQALVTAER
jgi:hypothetical protein